MTTPPPVPQPPSPSPSPTAPIPPPAVPAPPESPAAPDGPDPAAGAGAVSDAGPHRSLRATTGTGARAAVARGLEPAVSQGRFASPRAAGRAHRERLACVCSGVRVVLGVCGGGVVVAAEVAE